MWNMKLAYPNLSRRNLSYTLRLTKMLCKGMFLLRADSCDNETPQREPFGRSNWTQN